jgi:CspA family cold shock protein
MGFGFITPDVGGRDLFVNFRGIRGAGDRSLAAGRMVTYVVVLGDTGPSAINVEKH